MKSVEHLSVLLIEDNPSDVLLLREALEADLLSGFALTPIEQLADGLERLKKEHFDIVLVDLGLPDSTGIATFERLHRQAPDLPVVIFSGNEDEEQAVAAVRAGAQDYLVKSLSGFEMAARTIRYAIERQKNQASLRESENRFSKAFFTNPLSQSIISLQTGEVVEVNDACCHLYEYSREELIGVEPGKFNLWANPADEISALEELQSTGHLLPREIQIKVKSGEICTIIFSAEPITWMEAPCLITSSINITERKHVEEKLRASEERYRNLIENMNEVVMEVDERGSFCYISPSYQSLSGYSSEEELNTSAFTHVHPEDVTVLLQALESGTLDDHKRFEYRVQTKNGNWVWIETSVRTFHTEKGETHVIGVARNITDQKLAEEKLRESENKYRQLINGMNDTIWVIDFDTTILDVNGTASAVLGYTREELLSMKVSDIDLSLKPEQIEHLASSIPTDKTQVFESEHTAKDGRKVPVEVSSGLVMYMGRTVIMSIARDITERKEARSEAIHRQELLEKVIHLGKKIAAITELDGCWREIYNSARFELGFDRIGLFLYDESRQHVHGVYGTSRTGEIEETGLFDGPIITFGTWQKALQSPNGVSWLDDYQQEFNIPEEHEMYGVKRHVTVAAWSGEKPVALISADNLLTGREITPADVEALQLFAGYAGLAIENATLHTGLEEKVKARTAEVQDLYDNAPAGYHSLDSDGRIILVNKTELNWLGYAREEFVGHFISEFMTPDTMETFRSNFPEFLKRGWIRNLEMDFIRKDGSILPTLVNGLAIYDEQGKYTMSRSTVFDNSERKEAERALRESQANLQDFLDTASDLIQSLNDDAEYIYVNNAWSFALGYSHEEALKLSMFDVVDPASHEHCRTVLQNLVESGHPQQLEITFRTKSGGAIIVEGSVSGRTNKDGSSVTNGIFRNITSRKEAENALRIANIEMERALRMKDEFLASMSHELRTPLTGILGLSEALQYGTYGELNRKQQNILASVETSGRHLLDLINDILDISKMEAGKLELEMIPCALGDICQSSLQLVRGMANKKGQNITFSMNTVDVVVKGDPRRLKQIIVNLLSNAVKYSPENAPIGLEIRADEPSQMVCIEVWDRGMGIAPSDLTRLFQPFVQLDSSLSRRQSGTGLGLALVQRLVDLHGGSIQVESEPGQGSHFRVVLPYLPSDSYQKLESDELSTQLQQSLIVEDNSVDAGRLTRFLKMLGINSTVETTGTGVVEKAAETQPGVILLDLNLPDATGWEVLEQLKKEKLTRDIPVVITSVEEERERANEMGAAGYLVKLFTLDELRSTLSRIPDLDQHRRDTALVVSPRIKLGTIMIVDDNETNILMMEDFLESKNFSVFSARSGVEFFSTAPGIQPDLILMDIQMPDMNGLEITRRLRLLPDPRLASVPVIAITALAMPGDRERCLEAGANEYLSKPVRLMELISIVQNMLLENGDAASLE